MPSWSAQVQCHLHLLCHFTIKHPERMLSSLSTTVHYSKKLILRKNTDLMKINIDYLTQFFTLGILVPIKRKRVICHLMWRN
jgi:hypothetical protein